MNKIYLTLLITLVLAGCQNTSIPENTDQQESTPNASSEIGVNMQVLAPNDEMNFQNPQEEKAIELVKALPKVRKWLALFSNADGTSPSTGGKPVFAIENTDGNMYTVHAYESVNDHSATFNWYDVNLDTEETKSMF